MTTGEAIAKRLDAARKTLASNAEYLEKTIFSSPAGKKRIADRMAKMLPEHRVYTEAFVGSGSVLFAKTPTEVEIINDIDPGIAHAFLTLKRLSNDDVKKLAKLDWTGSKETYAKLYSWRPTSDICKLYRFLYLTNFSFMKSRGSSFDATRTGMVARTIKRIETFAPRLAKVEVRCGDYESVVRKYDALDAAHFLDAPYVGYDAGVREKRFDEQRFFELLKDIKGKFLVNYGERGELPKLAKKYGFVCKRLRTARQFAHSREIGGSDTLVHTIISNYEPSITKSIDDEFVEEELSLEDCEKAASAVQSKPTRQRKAVADSVKKTLEFQGISVHIDRPAGFEMSGVDSSGAEWTRTYKVDYGFIPNTEGGDEECLDVFMGSNPEAQKAFWIEQHKGDGSFDEFKVFLGYDNAQAAIETYKEHIPERYMGRVSEMPLSMLKAMLGVSHNIAKRWDDASDDEILEALKNFGPPNEWSGAVASIAGPKGRKAMKARWEALSTVEKERVLAEFNRRFNDSFEKTTKILKGINPNDERFVLGIVLEPETIDAQDDIYSEEEIRNAAHRFMEDFGGLGLQHQTRVNGKVKILECYIAPVEFTIGEVHVKKGTWIMAVRVIDDALWESVKTGDLTGFSIGGSARRVPEPNANTAPTEAQAA